MTDTATPTTVALVVGASRGIGAATASKFAAAGATTYGTHRGTGVPAGVTGIEADVTDEAAIAAAVRQVVIDHGRIDVVAVVAGRALQQLVVRTDKQAAMDLFETNTVGAMLVTKHAAKAMSRHRSGSIVLVSSETSRSGIAGSSAYTATKAALEGFMRSAMWEYGPLGIRINVVAPGATETDMFAPVTDEHRARLLANTPLRRFARPDEIADVIVWTAHSTYLTGACIPVTGGEGLGY